MPILTSPRKISNPQNQRIGLLGGSFNPAHDGHLEISDLAMRKLHLDGVWWLVSPQNPLKPVEGMAPLEQRIAEAARVADDPRITVSGIEAELGTRYTADTLTALCERFPNARFVWLMGADNLVQMHRWRQWSRIFHTVPVAVFARPTYSLRAEQAKAARRFSRYRLPSYKAARLADKRSPAWVLFKRPLNPLSATQLRRQELAK
ncbi:MAG: nicotinate-nucleotide adenylyltransferase [Rhodospirillaceae bacterium]|nr:nicotinate-nucleotide adenylyltransferase [Rhodospirillaceae bacterium]